MSNTLTIAIAGEIAPSKTYIPIINKLRKLENENKLNWDKLHIIGLYHGESSKELLDAISDETYSIGEGRRGNKKNSNSKLVYLITKDIIKAIKAMKGKKIDLLITCGNAGDVRKSIIAAKFLRIPIIHIEQDIYNPIEVIGLANTVTVPYKEYIDFLEDNYGLKNVVNIGGYPLVEYVEESIKNYDLNKSSDEYVLLVLGGDIKDEDLPELINRIENLNYPVFIAPYRFDKSVVKGLVSSDKIKVLDNYVDLFDYIPNAKTLIYAAGIGMTLEVGVFANSAVKIKGFHEVHGSVDLAKDLNIPIVEISDINNDLIENSSNIENKDLISNSLESIDIIVDLINNFSFSTDNSGFGSIKRIWKQRKKFR